MKLLRNRGQSTGEYAILFAIVLGAVIAMQNYVRNRIAGGIQSRANTYMTTVGGSQFDVQTSSDQVSSSSATMTTGTSGTVGSANTGVSVTQNATN